VWEGSFIGCLLSDSQKHYTVKLYDVIHHLARLLVFLPIQGRVVCCMHCYYLQASMAYLVFVGACLCSLCRMQLLHINYSSLAILNRQSQSP